MHWIARVAALVLLAACSDSAATAPDASSARESDAALMNAAEPTFVRERFEGSIVLGNPRLVACTGEPIELQYREQFSLQMNTLPNGRFHGKYHFNEQGTTGVGLTTGRKYQFMELQNEEVRMVGDLPYTITAISMRRAISQGSAGNFVVLNRYHVTLNADGTVVVERNDVSAECR
jgi:hypothetical protein